MVERAAGDEVECCVEVEDPVGAVGLSSESEAAEEVCVAEDVTELVGGGSSGLRRGRLVGVRQVWFAGGGVGVEPTTRKWVTVADVLAFLSGTAVRISEARLLLWSDVNLDAATVLVAGTKTHSARRQLSLPRWLVDRLRSRAQRYGTAGHVFSVTLLNGNTGPLDQGNLATSIRVVLDDAGLQWATPHSLRRGVATLLNQSGHSLRDIAGQLGHTDPSFTAKVYIAANLAGDKSHLAASLGNLLPDANLEGKVEDDQEAQPGR